jgi:hypothetical protein
MPLSEGTRFSYPPEDRYHPGVLDAAILVILLLNPILREGPTDMTCRRFFLLL